MFILKTVQSYFTFHYYIYVLEHRQTKYVYLLYSCY